MTTPPIREAPSAVQQDLMLLALLEARPEAVYQQVTFTLPGRPDPTRLRSVLEGLMERFAALRCRVRMDDDEVPGLEDAGQVEPPVEWRNPGGSDGGAIERAIEAARALPLGHAGTTGAELLWHLIAFSGNTAATPVLLRYHPALLDERSRTRLIELLAAGYCGAPPADAEASDIPDDDSPPDQAALKSFWQRAHGDIPPTVVWPQVDRQATPDGAELVEHVTLDESEERSVAQLAAAADVGEETVLLAAWALVVGRYAGADRPCIGVRAAASSSNHGLGFRDRAWPLAVEVPRHDSATAWLASLGGEVTEARRHAVVPALQLRQWRGRPSSPLYEILLVTDLDQAEGVRRGRLSERVGPSVLAASEPAGIPLVLTARREPRITLRLRSEPGYVSRDLAAALLSSLRTALATLAASPGASVGGTVLARAAVTAQSAAPEWTGGLARRVAAQAEATPLAVAAISGGEALSYAELDERAAIIAGLLRRSSVGPGSIVGLYLDRGLDIPAAVLGILRLGAAWLPLDPGYPRERMTSVLADAGAAVLLTQRSRSGELGDAGVPEVLIDEAPGADRAEIVDVQPDQPAYLIYTSGSTGRPKGVLISQANLEHYADAIAAAVGLEPSDRYLHTASMAFSSSVRQLAAPLARGATVVMARRSEVADPRELLALARRHRVTVMDLVPSYWTRVVEAIEGGDEGVASLRLALSASEPLPTALVQRWLAVAPPHRMVNMFGQTETTGIVATVDVTPQLARGTAIVPLGRPIAHTELRVVDHLGHPAPPGAIGEIVVGGAGVGLGYRGQPELTAERFVADADAPGSVRYHTGDLGVVRPDGLLAFVGRRDNQVKIRGHRVEVEEVEAVLRRHPGVAEAAVQARPDGAGESRLVAFAVANAGASPTARELRDFLGRAVPDYMIPSAIRLVDTLTRTPNGKIDRGSLSQLPVAFEDTDAAYVAPRTEAERKLAAIWHEVLGSSRTGVNDNFFDIGGHSLMAIRVLARIRAVLGVDLPLRVLFECPTIAALAEAVHERAAAAPVPPLSVLPDGAAAPLSFAQERLWVLNQIEPDSAAYNLVAAFRLRGSIDQAALGKALTEIVRRHEALRTVFPSTDGVPSQLVRPAAPFPLPVERLANPETREAELERRAATLAGAPFDLAEGPLFRGTLLQADENDHLLVLVMHHIVSDGWSRGVLYRELGLLYEAFAGGKPSPLPEPAIQYGDYAAWQREWLQGGVLDEQTAYWARHLAGPPATLDLPTDRPRPPMQTFRGATHTFRISAGLADRLRHLGAEADATPFMVLLAAFQSLLSRYSGQDDIVVGSPTAGRTRIETEELIGFFVNTLTLRTDLSGNPSFRTAVDRVRSMALEAFQHQDLPFERVVESLHLPRDLSRSPLFQVLFILQNTPVHPLALPGLTIEQVGVDAGAAKFDLTLSLVASDEGYAGHLEYNSDLFDPATIERLAGHYLEFLDAAAATPDRPIGRLGILPPVERRTLVETWNDTSTPIPESDTVAGQFEAQVQRTPDAPAASFEATTLSYRTLNQQANRLARHLRSLGVGPGSLVGIYAERSLEMLVGMLATLKAGGAYLPLDPSYPADRVSFMLEDSGASVVLTQARIAGRLGNTAATVVRLDADQTRFAGLPDTDLPPAAGPADLAYVIYTSGSTGRPKGVMIEHRNVINFLVGMDDRVGTDAPGTWLAVTSISFDISVLELFWTLTRGYHVIVQADPERVRGQTTTRSDRKVGFSLFYFATEATGDPATRYRLLMDGAKFADAHGFEAVWTPERHFHAFGGLYPSPAVVSAAIAATTTRVGIRTGSVVLPLHSPIRVAEDWAVVDNLSGGRVGLAFASGWHDRDFVFAPANYARRRDVMVEYIDIVQRLWRGEKVTLPGGSGKDVEVATLPRPIQPELPIWVTAAGTPETYERAGTLGLNVLTHLLGQTPETLREKIALYRSAYRRAGHKGAGHVSLMMHTFLHPDMETVRQKVWHPFREYLRTSLDLIKGLAEGRGQDIRSAEFTPEDMEALLDHAFNRYFDTSALMGTPESCMEMVERLKGMDIDEICCLIDFGVSEEDTFASLDHLAELRRRSDDSSATASADYDIPAQLERWNVTHFQCTPSMAGLLAAQPEARPALAGLRCLMVGGEAFPPALARDLSGLVGGRVINMYGPTETTIWSATHEVKADAPTVPLGTPIANTACYVVDRHFELLPAGSTGELLIGGRGVVRGYLNRPELTAERFLPDPFRPGQRVYRTGDLVRWRSDGVLEFLGRVDHQVKVRGHRIELGEIEAAVAGHPGVREVVVMAREDVPGDTRIVAYVVPATPGAVDTPTLREAVAARLPEYMVPAHVVYLDRFPRTPNLKIDRKALPAPDQGAGPATEVFVEPANVLEERITAIWKDVLRLQRVGVNDNFFDLGGHSLLTVKVHARLRSEIDRPVAITDIFRFPTIRSLAEHLGGGGAADAPALAEATQARADARREALQRRRSRRPRGATTDTQDP